LLSPQSHDWITQVVEIERHLFLEKCIITLSSAAHIKMNATMHAKSHCFPLLLSNHFPLHLLLHTHLSHAIARETDQTLLVIDDVATSKSNVASGAESDATPASSSSNDATCTMVKQAILMLQDYCKKSSVTEADHAAYHTTDLLSGGVISSISDLEFPTVDKTTIICFESNLTAWLGLPPSKFLVSILNFLRCELVHLNPNTITTLSCFSMLCKC
jgi:hypothetical protein